MNTLQKQIAEKLLKEILECDSQYRSNLIVEYAQFMNAVSIDADIKQMEKQGVQ